MRRSQRRGTRRGPMWRSVGGMARLARPWIRRRTLAVTRFSRSASVAPLAPLGSRSSWCMSTRCRASRYKVRRLGPIGTLLYGEKGY